MKIVDMHAASAIITHGGVIRSILASISQTSLQDHSNHSRYTMVV